MLRYYSYYSVGGYKDFFLGDSDNKAECTYYFPLLSFLEEEAKTSDSAKNRFDLLKTLPRIEQLSEKDTHELPKSANVLITHPGYKLMYKHLEGNVHALAIKDLSNNDKDDMGRDIPFLLIITGNTSKDHQNLGLLAVYMANNLASSQKMISECIGMDYELNGLQFHLSKFNAWVEKIVKEQRTQNVITVEGSLAVDATPNAVSLLVLPHGITEQQAIVEQKLSEMRVTSVAIDHLVTTDDAEKMLVQVTQMSDRLSDENRQLKRLKTISIIGAAVGFVVGLVLGLLL